MRIFILHYYITVTIQVVLRISKFWSTSYARPAPHHTTHTPVNQIYNLSFVVLSFLLSNCKHLFSRGLEVVCSSRSVELLSSNRYNGYWWTCDICTCLSRLKEHKVCNIWKNRTDVRERKEWISSTIFFVAFLFNVRRKYGW